MADERRGEGKKQFGDGGRKREREGKSGRRKAGRGRRQGGGGRRGRKRREERASPRAHVRNPSCPEANSCGAYEGPRGAHRQASTGRSIRKQVAEARTAKVQLRAAGGKTSQSLGYQIRREEDNREKAESNIRKIDQENNEYEEQTKAIHKKVEEHPMLRERYMQRKIVAEHRLAYLATQKAKESLPGPYMQRIRAAAGIIAESKEEALLPIKEFLSILVASPEGHYMGSEGESASSLGDQDSEATDEIMGRTGDEDLGGYEGFEEERRKEIAEARQRLATLQKQYQKDLDEAFRHQTGSQAVKRSLGEDKAKEGTDITMHKEEETKPLTPLQVVDINRQRIKREAEELQHLERLTAKEVVPVVPLSAATLDVATKATNQKDNKQRWQRSDATENLAKYDDARSRPSISSSASAKSFDAVEEGGAQAKHDQKNARRKPHPPLEVQLEILMQERLQKQQEVERLTEISGCRRWRSFRKPSGKPRARSRGREQCHTSEGTVSLERSFQGVEIKGNEEERSREGDASRGKGKRAKGQKGY